jgi:PAS domain S-box-containing protein
VSDTTLEATVALLEATLEATHDAILVVDLDGRIIRYNRRFLNMLGLTAEDLDARGSDAILAAVSAQVEDADQALIRAREHWRNPSAEVLDLLRFKDGRVFQRFVAPHRIGGQVVGRVGTYRDISESVRTAAALEQHRAFLEKFQEVAHVGGWVVELDGSGNLGWSAETHRIFGVPQAEFPGTSAAFFGFVHPDDLAAVRSASEEAINAGKPYDIDHRIVRADGEVRWVHERADIARDANGAALRMVGTVQDITDHRQIEEQLRHAQRLEAIGRLAGGVAHDLNNALTTIAGYTELALGTLDEGHPARPDVQEIRRAAERAESVTRQLLAFSRKQLLAPRVFSLHESVANLSRLLGRLLGDDTQLHTAVADDLPAIYGDSGQIEQAILNLAVNARDAMPDGGRLTLGVAVVDVDEAFARTHQPMPAGRYVELSVADTGHGMTPDIQARIFEPFFTTKEIGKGTGLGLAMVYGTVQQSGGFIFVDSAPGRGATFRLYFPPAAAAHATRPQTAPAGASEATLLVVEDEAPVRKLVVATLEREGYRVLHAPSAHDALEIAAAHAGPIDLLLTDATMPGMSGIELATRLVQQRPAIRVMVMSGYTEVDITVASVKQPVELLAKPFTPRELRQRIRGVFAATAASGSNRKPA